MTLDEIMIFIPNLLKALRNEKNHPCLIENIKILGYATSETMQSISKVIFKKKINSLC